ncbi:universal stress protein [Levilactobacillus angrenensis]|uniref:Universal stress protein n=1 Tax=Levilactobacillus angrenensis TaxID=2486020 RepID=A0ABW1U5I6_9LACO|nr:universal stress protein [Levilactobacillus angrenensis]
MTTIFRKILVGVDDSPDALLAFKYAIHQAKRDQATLVIVSILESENMNVYQVLDTDFVHGEYAALKDHLQGYRQQALDAGVADVQVMIAEGEPGETIVKDVIPKVQPDILIVGSIAKQGVSRHFGSQAAYMAKYAPISVLVVR